MFNLDGIELPFSAIDLVVSGGKLLGLVGLFVLLNLSFHFVPMLIGAIKDAFLQNYHSDFAREHNRFHKEKFGMTDKQIRKMNRDSFRYGVGYNFRRRKREWDNE